MISGNQAAGADRLGERVYRSVKAEVLSLACEPGQRLEAGILADSRRASVTPVRAALHRLVGEGLVETHPHDGFRRPHVSEAALRDLYDWNRRILDQALGPTLPGPPPALRLTGPDMAASTAELFDAIAKRCPNRVCALALSRMNDHLHTARLAETAVLADVDEELAVLRLHYNEGSQKQLRRMLHRHHQRRLRTADRIVARLYLSGRA